MRIRDNSWFHDYVFCGLHYRFLPAHVFSSMIQLQTVNRMRQHFKASQNSFTRLVV